MKHIVLFSGGKDSTCMLLMMLEKGMVVDEILFCDTGKEFPFMYEHIKKVGTYIKEKYNKEITFLQPEKDFNYYMFERKKTKGNSMDSLGYGWATRLSRWCTDRLKTKVVNKYLRGKKDYKLYIGIAYDEPERIKEHTYPLVDWGITEQKALEYCTERGFDWGGLYIHFRRVSCWCCPLQNLQSLRSLWKHYPKLWAELKDMDKRSINQFKEKYSVEDLEVWFKYEEDNNLPPTRINRKLLEKLKGAVQFQ